MRTTKRYDFDNDDDDDDSSDSDDYSDDDDFDDKYNNRKKGMTSRSDMSRYLGGRDRSKRQIPVSVHVPVGSAHEATTHSSAKTTTSQEIDIPARIQIH